MPIFYDKTDKDRPETEHYIQDINLDTEYLVLDEQYSELKRAVLNYSPKLMVRELVKRCDITPLKSTEEDIWKGTYLIVSTFGNEEYPLFDGHKDIYKSSASWEAVDDIMYATVEYQRIGYSDLESGYFNYILARPQTEKKIRTYNLDAIKAHEISVDNWLLNSDFTLKGKKLTTADILAGAKLEFQAVPNDKLMSFIYPYNINSAYKYSLNQIVDTFTSAKLYLPNNKGIKVNGVLVSPDAEVEDLEFTDVGYGQTGVSIKDDVRDVYSKEIELFFPTGAGFRNYEENVPVKYWLINSAWLGGDYV